MMGSDDEDADYTEQPIHEVRLDSYYLSTGQNFLKHFFIVQGA